MSRVNLRTVLIIVLWKWKQLLNVSATIRVLSVVFSPMSDTINP